MLQQLPGLRIDATPNQCSKNRETDEVVARVESGRSAFRRGAWREAFDCLQGVDALEQQDVERLAVAAQLVGEQRASELAWERAHRLAAAGGDFDRAAKAAFWLGFDLLLRFFNLLIKPADLVL